MSVQKNNPSAITTGSENVNGADPRSANGSDPRPTNPANPTLPAMPEASGSGAVGGGGGDPVPEAPSAPDDCEVSADALDELGDEIATLSAHIHAATYRLLCLIARFDRCGGWKPDGHRSCAHWLAFRTGINLGAAREKVRAARALEELPRTRSAMEHGELSFAQVRALTRVARPDTEQELLDYAKVSTAAQLERLTRSWRLHSRADEAELERRRHRSRTFSIFPDEAGMYVVRGKLMPDVAALLMKAVEAGSAALYRSDDSGAEPQQRRADALGLVAERAFAAGFGNGNSGNGKAAGEAGCGCGKEIMNGHAAGSSCGGGERWSGGAFPGDGACAA